jgi:hypothetical protein
MHSGQWIFGQLGPFNQILVETAKCGEAKADIGSCHSLFHAVQQEGAKLWRSATPPRRARAREQLELVESMFVSDYRSGRRISLDLKIFKVSFEKMILFGVRHSR